MHREKKQNYKIKKYTPEGYNETRAYKHDETGLSAVQSMRNTLIHAV